MRQRLTDDAKRLRGTLHKRPVPASIGTPRLARPIAAPKDMDPELRRQWRTHMAMVVATGRASSVDLLAFVELIRAAQLVAVAFVEAIAEGPTVPAEKGQTKTGSAWRAYLIASHNYRTWLSVFGLTPRGRQAIRQLPALAGELHIVGGDDDD